MNKAFNYTPSQVAMIAAAAAANGGVLNLDIAKTLAADPAMNGAEDSTSPGPRNYKSIVAKINRMVTSGETVEIDGEPVKITYARKVAVSKDGSPVSKKSDIVNAIAEAAGVSAAKLDGLDKAPKLALVTIRDALAA